MLKSWRTWAVLLLAVLVMALAVVVVVQAVMLRSRGWTVPLGNVAEWLAAVGTVGARFVAERVLLEILRRGVRRNIASRPSYHRMNSPVRPRTRGRRRLRRSGPYQHSTVAPMTFVLRLYVIRSSRKCCFPKANTGTNRSSLGASCCSPPGRWTTPQAASRRYSARKS